MNESTDISTVIIYEITDVPWWLHEMIHDDVKDERKGYDENQDVLFEQMAYIYQKHPGSYMFAVMRNGVYMGGVFLFTEYSSTAGDVDIPFIQGITKSIAGAHAGISLNKILIPAVVEYTKKLGFTILRCAPYPKQKDILTKHYGFKEESSNGMVVCLDL